MRKGYTEAAIEAIRAGEVDLRKADMWEFICPKCGDVVTPTGKKAGMYDYGSLTAAEVREETLRDHVRHAHTDYEKALARKHWRIKQERSGDPLRGSATYDDIRMKYDGVARRILEAADR